MRRLHSPYVALLTTLALVTFARPASAQGVARAGPFDPRSGKFSGVISTEPTHAPDTVVVSTVACASSGVLEDKVAELLRKALGV